MRVLIALLMFVASMAHGQTRSLPTDADLKTAYCITVVKKNIQSLSMNTDPPGSPARNMIDDLLRDRNNELHRLQSYLLPKLPSLDATGLIAASNRGEADSAASLANAQQCGNRCESTLESGKPGDKWVSCIQTCSAENPAATRVASCRNINWLPF